jgi:transposase
VRWRCVNTGTWFLGDDWAQDHHDIELQDEQGRRLVTARLPEGVAGIARLQELVAAHLPEGAEPRQVLVGIETDRGPWVQALIGSGYQVYGVNPKQAARHRELLSLSGAKSDKADAAGLADMVRTRRHQLRQIAADSEHAQAIQVLARAHKSMIWERTRQTTRLRSALLEYFPGALVAYQPLTLAGADTLELLAAAPDPASAAALTIEQVTAALRRARRRNIASKAQAIVAALAVSTLAVPDVVVDAYGATVRAAVAVIATLNTAITQLHAELAACFTAHPQAKIYLSQPGIGIVAGARMLAEFGDQRDRYASAKARKNYAGTSPITRQSGKAKVVHARFVHNDRLVDAAHTQAMSALTASVGARRYYDQLRAREIGHHDALRRVSNRLIGILHGCLAGGTLYNEELAWSHRDTPTDQPQPPTP